MTVTIPPPVHPDRAAMIRQILEWPGLECVRVHEVPWRDLQPVAGVLKVHPRSRSEAGGINPGRLI